MCAPLQHDSKGENSQEEDPVDALLIEWRSYFLHCGSSGKQDSVCSSKCSMEQSSRDALSSSKD